MLKLSEDPNYRQWGACFSKGEYLEAIRHVEIVLERARVDGDPLTIGHLLFKIARTYVELGDYDSAFRKLEEADVAAGGDPQQRLRFAKFWYELHDRPDLALEWVKRIVDKHDLITSHGNTAVINQDDVVRAARESIVTLEEIIAEQDN